MAELPRSVDILIVGGGVVGLTLALGLRRAYPAAAICVLEKERRCGEHASGRNSGVLHAGFYYGEGSLKAQLTQRGNQLLRAWCAQQGAALRACGKLVVTRSAEELPRLRELFRRAALNGAPVELVDEAKARELEPHARTVGQALWSPTTAAVSPRAVMARLAEQCNEQGVQLLTSTAWLGTDGGRTRTSRGSIAHGYLVNAAGAYADRIAHAHGLGDDYLMLPFKGLYLYGDDSAVPLARHVYPVPDLGMPFLGVHFTVTTDGGVKIGPTAMPAPWREAYALLKRRYARRFSLRELREVAGACVQLALGDGSFRRHALSEAPKMLRHVLVRRAQALVPGARLGDFKRWGPPGIRAQLFDRRARRLVMDFHYERGPRSIHILNAVSPAFTCSFAFAQHLIDEVLPSL